MNGNLIIVSAPSGAGKTTLVSEVVKRDGFVKPSVSYTSRVPRLGEVDGVHYHFVTSHEFERMIDNGDFLEWAEVHGNLYGTSRRQVEALLMAGFDVVLTIDVQGAEQVRRLFPAAIGVFIMPPSYGALIERLDARGSNIPDDFHLRMRNALDELAQYQRFDYIVINEDLDRAADELSAIMIAERCRLERRIQMVDHIRQTFIEKKELNGYEESRE